MPRRSKTWSRNPFHLKAEQTSVRNSVWELKSGMHQWFCCCKQLKKCLGTNSVSHTLFLPPSKSPNGVGGGALEDARVARALLVVPLADRRASQLHLTSSMDFSKRVACKTFTAPIRRIKIKPEAPAPKATE